MPAVPCVGSRLPSRLCLDILLNENNKPFVVRGPLQPHAPIPGAISEKQRQTELIEEAIKLVLDHSAIIAD